MKAKILKFFFLGFSLGFVLFALGGALIAVGQWDLVGRWPYYHALPLALLLSVVFGIVSSVVGLLLPGRAADIGATLLQGLTVTAFLVTVLIPQGVAQLDGSTEGANGIRPYVYCIWFAYLLAVILYLIAARRWPTVLAKLYAVSAVLSGVVVAAITALSFMPSTEMAASRSETLPDSALYGFGKDKNVVVILMDMLQGSFMEQAISARPEVANAVADFRVFSRATSTFPFTNYSLPTILSGKAYAADSADRRYVANLSAAIADSFLTDASKLGYETVGVQAVPTMPVHERNVSGFGVPSDPNAPSSSYSEYIRSYQAKVVAYGGLLRVLKWNFGWVLGRDNELDVMKESGANLLKRWAAQATLADVQNKAFFVHNLLTHAPIVYDEDGVRYVDSDRYPWTHENLLKEIDYSFGLLNSLFQRMRDLGVYDDSLIIVLGDHGHFMGYTDDAYEEDSDFAGYRAGRNFRPAGMYNPAILIKPPQSQSGGVTHDRLGLTDVRHIIDLYLDGAYSQLDKAVRTPQPTEGSVPVVGCVDEDSAYFSTRCHILLESTGNVSTLPALFETLDTGKGTSEE